MKMIPMMTKPTIPVWTDRPAQAILLAVITVLFFALAALDVHGLRLVTVLLMGFVVITSALGGGALGLVAGIVGASAFIGIHIAAGQWNGRDEAVQLVLVSTFLSYGGLCGLLAGHLRHRHNLLRRKPAAGGAGGSLGLLTAEQGRAVFYRELQRSRIAGEPLGLITVHAAEVDALNRKATQHALRAVARSLESAAEEGSFPVLLDRARFGLILRNHDAAQLAVLRDQLLPAIGRATFADREAGARRTVRDAMRLQAVQVVVSGPQAEAEVLRAFSIPGTGGEEGTIRAAA